MIFLRQDRGVKFYIYLVKQLLHNHDFTFVELHGAGESNIFNSIKVTEVLTKYNYVTMTRIKTKTLFKSSQKAAKIVIVLSKTTEFDRIYQEFEENKAKRSEERGFTTMKQSDDVDEKQRESEVA